MNVTNGLLKDLPKDLAENIPDVKLRDEDIKVSLAQGTLTQDGLLPPKLDLADFTLSFEAQAEATVRNFNSPGDVDENGVVGEVSEAPEKEDAPRPQLLLGGKQGWMRYQATARVKAGVATALPFLAFDSGGEVTVGLSDYRVHGLDENMRAAATADLAKPRLAVQKTDLTKLAPGDALAWQVRGALKAGVDVNWADLLTANLARLTFVRGDELIALKVGLQASLSASVSFTDDYLLSFSRPAAGRILVSLRKARSHEAALGAGLSLSVELADPASVQKQLGDILSSLAGQPLAQVDAWVEKASQLKLNETGKVALRLVLERLGLDPQLADLSNIKVTWEGYKEKVRGAAETALKTQIAAGFRYEYLRTSESSTLLEVTLDEAIALKFHGSLIRGNLVDLLQWTRDPANAKAHELHRYLNRTAQTRQRGYSLSVGLGTFELLKAQGTTKRTWVSQENTQGARRVAFLGRRSYEDKLLGNRGQWAVDLRADMEQYALGPTASDFRYGLQLTLWGRQKKLSRKEAQQAIDDAVVWGVLDASNAASVLEAIQDQLGKAPIETQLDVKLDDDTFRAIVPKLQTLGQSLPLFARALARAMPWSEEPARATAEARAIVYAPMWASYLGEVGKKGGLMPGDLSPTRAAQIAEWFIKQDASVKALGSGLLLKEKTWTPPGGNFSFAEVTEKNRDTYAKCRGFVEGLVRLRRAIDERKATSELEKVFGDLEGLWNTGFHLRATGALLIELALGTTRGLAGVERTFSVRLGDQDQQLLFTTSRASGTP